MPKATPPSPGTRPVRAARRYDDDAHRAAETWLLCTGRGPRTRRGLDDRGSLRARETARGSSCLARRRCPRGWRRRARERYRGSPSMPRPRPVALVEKNGSNNRRCVSSSMPHPVSETSTNTNLSATGISRIRLRSSQPRVAILHAGPHGDRPRPAEPTALRGVDDQVQDHLLHLGAVEPRCSGERAGSRRDRTSWRAREPALESVQFSSTMSARLIGSTAKLPLPELGEPIRLRQVAPRAGWPGPTARRARARPRSGEAAEREIEIAQDRRQQVVEVAARSRARQDAQALEASGRGASAARAAHGVPCSARCCACKQRDLQLAGLTAGGSVEQGILHGQGARFASVRAQGRVRAPRSRRGRPLTDPTMSAPRQRTSATSGRKSTERRSPAAR